MIGPAYDIFDHYTGGEDGSPGEARIVLNMIVGGGTETYLPISLEALYDQVDWAVINFNGPTDAEGKPTTLEGQANLDAILASRFNQSDRLTISGAPFRNYAFNRNLCLELSRRAEWIVQFDPDEVIYPGIVRRGIDLGRKHDATRVLAHYWHFLKGFTEVQNVGTIDGTYFKPFAWKMHPDLSWFGAVHERLCGLTERDLHLPENLWVHLGYVDPVHVFNKWVQFSEVSGNPNEYQGYFADPNAPWRTGPETILDDRPRHPFPGELPDLLKPFVALREKVRALAGVESEAEKATEGVSE